MITKREQDCLCFIEDFHIATMNQLYKLFYKNTSLRYAQYRLAYLTKQGFVKRTRSTIDNSFAYYCNKKPVQIHHDLLRAEIFINLNKIYNVLNWANEYPIVNIRPDAFAYINDHGIEFPVFIEIHLNNKFNFEKYENLVKNKDLFEYLPRVLIVTDRKVDIPKGIGLKFKIIDVDMKGLDSIFK